MNIQRCIAIGTFAVALSVLAIPARAVEAERDDGGIPSTAVARLKIGKGTAWVRSGDSGEWQESSHNYTLAERSRVSVPQGSEAEIQFRGSQSLLLRGGSEVDIRQLGEKEVSYRLRSGQAVLSLPKEDFAPVRVKVPGNRRFLLRQVRVLRSPCPFLPGERALHRQRTVRPLGSRGGIVGGGSRGFGGGFRGSAGGR